MTLTTTTTSQPFATAKKARILLLEDDADLRELIVDYYQPRGYVIEAHEDPSIPLAKLERSPDTAEEYDLVITDLKMPRVDGIQLTRRLKKVAPKLPIILMTANTKVE